MTQPNPNRRGLLLGAAALAAIAAAPVATGEAAYASSPWRKLSDAQWKKRLPPASYAVLRKASTERPYASPLNNEHRKGVFVCLGCDLPLFRSEWKFDSHTGWPSFYTAIAGALGKKTDLELLGIPRTEYHCARCLGHQGHVFDDGPAPTGLRYCNNGVALTFVAA